MPGFDTGASALLGIGQGVVQPETDPWKNFERVLNIARGINELRSSRQTLAAREAIGRHYQEAYDANTGKMSYDRLQSLIEQDPATAWMAPEYSKQLQEQQGRQYGLNESDLKQKTNRMEPFNRAMIPLLSLGDRVQTNDVYRVIKGLHAAGLPADEFIADAQQTMPLMDPAQRSDPRAAGAYGHQLRDWIYSHATRAMSPEVAARYSTPDIQNINTGGEIRPTDENVYTNPGIVGSQIKATLSPAEQMSPQSGVHPDGSGYTITTGDRAAQSGHADLLPQRGSDVFGTGRVPMPDGQAAPQPAAPEMQTSVGTAQQAAAQNAGQGSGNDLHAMYANNAGSAARIFQIQQAQRALEASGGVGPGTEGLQHMKSYLMAMAPGVARTVGFDPAQIASYDEAKKYMTQIAMAQGGAMGSDSRMATAISGNASIHISDLAARDVLKAALGLERMGQAQTSAWSRAGLPESQYDQWDANWKRSVDPRAFVFDELTPEQRGKVLHSIPLKQRSAFLDQVWDAAQSGMIDGERAGLGAH
ncbi:hypothetical protein J2D73_19355 [Acetobacter sacchari]|uniref:Uncharacterized protein n=1 Tax=Acetobacter sacchari TaxID=2661687 RepID=A0ABS3M193_9PROT|nr:hypothetical protein [Acetobacter sacchari]MBO1361944.1 hypothetical protein [Acetobacter sacchari]